MNLFDPNRHEELNQIAWNAQELENFTQSILLRTSSVYSPQKYWPVHPLDADPDPIPEVGFQDFYFGAGGNFWCLDYLKLTSQLDVVEAFNRFLDNLNFGDESNVSIFFDHIAFLLFQEKILPSKENRDLLYKTLQKTPDNNKNEILYGIPSTALATFHAYKLTQEARFLKLFKKFKDWILAKWTFDENSNCYLWTQDFGSPQKYVGAAHGIFGNLQVLFTSRELLTSAETSILEDRATMAFRNLSITSQQHANWPVLVDSSKKILLHWCHGAPGVICALADHLPDDHEVNSLFLKSGELIWHAGPLKKGTSLCHGTAGNAMAFLKLFKRTHDEKWLERAKAFAMHCLHQCKDMEKTYGQFRYSLWTGDLGLVWLNEQIKNQTADMPILDTY